MEDLKERKFGFMPPPPPPPQCPTHGGISMGDWMKYINTYIDVRARQIYDKLKGQTGGGSGDTNVIEEIKVNSIALPIRNKSVNITVPEDSTDLKYEGDSEETIHDKIEDLIGAKDYILLKDKSDTGKIYKVYMDNGSLCSDEYTI